MRKKKQIHCGECSSPAEWYKKGRSHRVLVCPHCGIIANNPLPLAMLAATALPSIIDKVTGKKKAAEPGAMPARQYITHKNANQPTKGERYVKMALGGHSDGS